MERFHRLSGLAPVFISLLCVVMVLTATAKFCVPPRVDEGAEAHIFQLLMAAQVPIALAFVFTRSSRPFGQLLPVLALQIFAWGVAAASAALLT
jgi:hypothetical protein